MFNELQNSQFWQNLKNNNQLPEVPVDLKTSGIIKLSLGLLLVFTIVILIYNLTKK